VPYRKKRTKRLNGKAKKRGHPYRPTRERPGSVFPGMYRCDFCGKWAYATRADAEAGAEMLHPGSTLHFYQCELAPAEQKYWHFTSMSAAQLARYRKRLAS
jgi:hypothetical protein